MISSIIFIWLFTNLENDSKYQNPSPLRIHLAWGAKITFDKLSIPDKKNTPFFATPSFLQTNLFFTVANKYFIIIMLFYKRVLPQMYLELFRIPHITVLKQYSIEHKTDFFSDIHIPVVTHVFIVSSRDEWF